MGESELQDICAEGASNQLTAKPSDQAPPNQAAEHRPP